MTNPFLASFLGAITAIITVALFYRTVWQMRARRFAKDMASSPSGRLGDKELRDYLQESPLEAHEQRCESCEIVRCKDCGTAIPIRPLKLVRPVKPAEHEGQS